MIKSMTGYGKASNGSDGISINVEIRSLNSKYLDLSLKLPRIFSDKELDIRNLVSKVLVRGKVSLVVDYEDTNSTIEKVTVNEDLFMAYHSKLTTLSEKVGYSGQDIFRMAIQMPDVIIYKNDDNEIPDEVWNEVLRTIEEGLAKCDEFRLKEGTALGDSFKSNIERIRGSLNGVVERDPQRVDDIKLRLRNAFRDWEMAENLDENRFEQELLYYMDKLDINEEKVRLSNHLDHFLEAMDASDSQGKKLNFISQEIGREINTIGSKSYDSQIQRHVVNMKDELEQIKEQLSNIL
ncbi:YicC/YloC family endoribonuclease [Fulvivirgaceae bacterium LMO-SS25]